MPKIVWGAPSTRTYETGLDRGILYPPSGPPVVWPGLIKVEELTDDYQIDSEYFEGRKYRTTSTRGLFKARLTAFAAPPEFAPCEGHKELAQGLYATRQPRLPFSLCYRTLIGNDIQGNDYGYKLHFIYNAIATSSSVAVNTLAGTTKPSNRTWMLRSIPYNKREFVWFKDEDGQYYEHQRTAYYPVSHLVISSLSVQPETLALIEQVVYGTDTTEPELPTPVELIEMMR